MEISLKTHKMIWGRAAARCSLPDCRRKLALDATEKDGHSLIGEICHIVADSEDGPRGRSSLTVDERSAYDNLLLLCRNHHKEIDDHHNTWSVDRLKNIKLDHEQWVENSLSTYDLGKQKDDETYADYVDYWTQAAHLNDWADWSSFINSSEPRLNSEIDEFLSILRNWLSARIWPGRYIKLENAFKNFSAILGDFLDVFHKYSYLPWPSSEFCWTRKFYKDDLSYGEEYRRMSREYDRHVALVGDLMLELTRAANLLCDEIRTTLNSSYRLKEGRVLIYIGMDNLAPIQYSADEIASSTRYPGLDIYRVICSTRAMPERPQTSLSEDDW
jgi:hypothetical protein